MDLVPLIYAALAFTATLIAVECASLNPETPPKERERVLELRQQGLNPDYKLNDFSSAEVMEQNGWKIDAKNSMDPHYSEWCGTETWFGYTSSDAIGYVEATFVGKGRATLTFGNCNKEGSVVVKLDGKEISSAKAKTLEKVEFQYSQGNTLRIEEINTAIIKLNSLSMVTEGSAPSNSPTEAPTQSPAKTLTDSATSPPISASPSTADSLKSCGLSVMDKCYEHNPPDGSAPGNLIEEIGAVDNATTCQQFCNELYPTTCGWFMYDRTTSDCKIFRGSLSDLENDCTESGYAIRPPYSECSVANVKEHNGCYNFREDYCRFEFSLLDNLEAIEKIEDCQLACQYLTNCTFFIYDSPSKICKLNTDPFNKRICDIVHGSKEPSLQQCLDDGEIPWTTV